MPTMRTPTTIEDLAEEWTSDLIPRTEDRPRTHNQEAWARDGMLIIEDLIPDDLLEPYEAEWLTHNGGPHAVDGAIETYWRPSGWEYVTPYMDHPGLRALVCSDLIGDVVAELIGEPAGVHLNLTGWQSTRRRWHFDQYLNEPYVGGFYVAIWIALDDVDPDAGPFEFVRGSHRWWPPISQAKMKQALGPALGYTPQWPAHSERILTPIFERELHERAAVVEQFLPSRGDVLFWHSRLLHQGSIPRNPALERRGLIAHYSGVTHRPDMPAAQQHPNGGWFFPLAGHQPAR